VKWLLRLVLLLENAPIEAYCPDVKTFNGHSDGKVIVLDEPADLVPNTKVKIIAPTRGTRSELAAEFAVLSESVFHKIWDNPLDAEYDSL
jgi:hypothetical protein